VTPYGILLSNEFIIHFYIFKAISFSKLTSVQGELSCDFIKQKSPSKIVGFLQKLPLYDAFRNWLMTENVEKLCQELATIT
jgi:hypothetical protein